MSSLISLNAGPGSTDTRLTGARRKRPIGLTALIDVVFILLMFFMLTSSFIHQKAITVDSAAAGQSGADTPPPAILLLRTDLSVIWSADEQTAPAFYESLQAATADIAQTEETIVLMPEAGLPLQNVLNAWQGLQDAGINAVLAESVNKEVADSWN